jgi:glucose/arabinose dehydrogenase
MRALGGLVLAALAATAAGAQPLLDDPGLAVELVTDELAAPASLTFIGDDDFLVIQKNDGRVMRVTSGSVTGAVLDLPVNSAGERGGLGIAAHPDFGAGVQRDWVYVYFTESGAAGDVSTGAGSFANRVVRYVWDGAALGGATPILTLPGDASTHNGGVLAFGPDRMLYGVIGDNQRDGQLQNNAAGAAPDDTGMIFRVDEDGAAPADNPFFALGGSLQKVYAYGVRNSFGLGFDPLSGDLWDTENGPGSFDEVNRVVPGFNSGWRDVMGPGMPAGLVAFAGSTYLEPAYSIQNPVAVTGLSLASEGTALGEAYAGDLLVGDFNQGQLYRFPVNAARDGLALADDVANSQAELDGFRFASGFEGGVTDLEEGPDGWLYVVEIFGNAVHRIGANGGGSDFAVTKLKQPRRVALSERRPLVTKKGSVQLRNEGTGEETISDAAALAALLELSIETSGGACPAPELEWLPPKKGFPVVVRPRKKLKLSFLVHWDCAGSFESTFRVSLPGDADPSDDVCPRPRAGEDRGCGRKPAGSPLGTDVVSK